MSDACRPESFEGFVGQEKPKRVLQILCRAARARNACVPHTLICGPSGVGKSSLAAIVANEMGARLVTVMAGNVGSAEEMAKSLMRLKERDVLLLDETHSLGGGGSRRNVEEVLYGALEDGHIPVVQSGYDEMLKGLGLGRKQPTISTFQLPPFTCIGATTLSGLISDPLRSRFTQCVTLEPYSDEELALIVRRAAAKMSFAIDGGVTIELARRSRATARTAVANVRWLAEYCAGTGSKPDARTVAEAFALKEITPEGLTKVDVAYLTALVEAGEPLGLSTLAAAVGEGEETLAQAVEPFLLRGSYIRKGPRGRIATAKAVELVNGRAA